MKRRLAVLAVTGVAMAASFAHAQTALTEERGRRLARTYCGECHALGEGRSPMRDAPPFARLYLRYPRGGGLADLLGEGMIAPAMPQEEGAPKRHPRMPQVKLDEDQVSDLVAFLRAAQPRGEPRP